MSFNKFILLAGYLIVSQLIGTNELHAQSSKAIPNDVFSIIQEEVENEGIIYLYQEASLHVLIDKYKRLNKGSLKGYRIQLYRGLGQKAREESNLAGQQFMTQFSDFNSLQVYTIYDTPYFKLRVGDYRNKNEAFEFLYQVKKFFPNAYIVNSRINYPRLEAVYGNANVDKNTY